VNHIFIYPDNLTAKATLWLWQLRDIAIIGAGLLLSVLALAQGGFLLPLVLTVLFAFLSIRVEDSSILDFLRYAACFLFLSQQYYEWRDPIDP
jgi:Zn-dependent protease with chaperone function